MRKILMSRRGVYFFPYAWSPAPLCGRLLCSRVCVLLFATLLPSAAMACTCFPSEQRKSTMMKKEYPKKVSLVGPAYQVGSRPSCGGEWVGERGSRVVSRGFLGVHDAKQELDPVIVHGTRLVLAQRLVSSCRLSRNPRDQYWSRVEPHTEIYKSDITIMYFLRHTRVSRTAFCLGSNARA